MELRNGDELIALPSSLFVAISKMGGKFLLRVSSDLANWSDEINLTDQLPVVGYAKHINLFQDNSGRFVMT